MGASALISLAAAAMKLLAQALGWARDAEMRKSGRIAAENDALVATLEAERDAHEAEIAELSRPILIDDDGLPVDDGFRRD